MENEIEIILQMAISLQLESWIESKQCGKDNTIMYYYEAIMTEENKEGWEEYGDRLLYLKSTEHDQYLFGYLT